jgi:hypothetical protein
MPPKAVVTEAAPNVYRDSLLGLSLETATRELIANQGALFYIEVETLFDNSSLCFDRPAV